MSVQPEIRHTQNSRQPGTFSGTIQPGCSPQEIERMFSAIVNQYDQHNRLFSMGLDVWWRHRLVKGIVTRPKARILDLAAGTLDVSRALLRRFPLARVYAVDICRDMLEYGLQGRSGKRAGTGRSRIVPVVASAFDLPFSTESIDAVTLSFGLRNMNPRGKALRELFRVLKPGGSVHILELAPVRTPLVGGVCRWYMGKFVPGLASLTSPHAGAYRYLAESVKSFPEPRQLSAELIAAGFSTVNWQAGFLGVVAIHRASKPE